MAEDQRVSIAVSEQVTPSEKPEKIMPQQTEMRGLKTALTVMLTLIYGLILVLVIVGIAGQNQALWWVKIMDVLTFLFCIFVVVHYFFQLHFIWHKNKT